ncbi:hypothetical protein PMIN03_013103 [Paraphaeosphaeria minitans]
MSSATITLSHTTCSRLFKDSSTPSSSPKLPSASAALSRTYHAFFLLSQRPLAFLRAALRQPFTYDTMWMAAADYRIQVAVLQILTWSATLGSGMYGKWSLKGDYEVAQPRPRPRTLRMRICLARVVGQRSAMGCWASLEPAPGFCVL